ncbi:MAG: GNAT family N-acetyltransferase [Halodesulfurarchaeum sp.]
MEFAVLGWPPDGPKLRLDWQRFAYAGKFVMTNTGKAVARSANEEPGSVLAATAFNEDRTDPGVAWIRYITVRDDRRGEGIGARLAGFTARCLEDGGYERVRIAVNNPFAYQALYKAGFGYTGRTTGLAELVLERPSGRAREPYRRGLRAFQERELDDDDEGAFVEEHLENGRPPPSIEVPKDGC